MDKKIIKSLIDEKLEVIQEQFAIIKEYEGKIPNIELDLYMASIRDLYELVLNLQAENVGSINPPAAPAPASRFTTGIISMEPAGAEEAPEPAPPVKEPLPPPVIPEPEPPAVEPPSKPDPTHTPSPEPDFPPEPLVPPAPVPGPVPEPAPSPSPSSSPDGYMAEPEPATIHSSEKQPKLTVDLFSDMAGSTLADRLKEGQEKRIADKLKENKTPDLRTTIGINEKFLFINELFEGNMRVYDEAVQKLNTSSTIAQADLLLLDMKIAYNWDSDSPTVKKFVELVRRKF